MSSPMQAYMNVLNNVNWNLLYMQRQILNVIRFEISEDKIKLEVIEGVLNLLDALSDAAELEGDFSSPEELD